MHSVLASEPIFSSTALATRQREVKDAAKQNVVHITENGNGAYIFCSEAIFSERMKEVRQEALYEARMVEILARAKDDFNKGRYCDDPKEFRTAVLAKRDIDD